MFAPSSITEHTVTDTSEKQYLSLEYKAKTYKVNFDPGEATQDSIQDIPSKTTLKYTQTLDSALVQKMKSVQKAPSQYKNYEFKRLVVKETGDEFYPTSAYNQDITVKPEFEEKDVYINVVPRVKTADLAKTNEPAWPAQNLVVGTHFNFTPTTNIKPGWDFVGWAKTEDGVAEDIVIERITTEVFAVFKPGQTTYGIKHVFEGVDDIEERTQYITKLAITESTVSLTDADKLSGYDAGFIAEIPQASKTIKADGSTEFIINYKRRLFDVNFTVNYQNKFEGRPSPNPQTQKVKYEGKVNIPGVPTIEKHGRTYLFKHWQLESSMNGVYTEQTAYDFAIIVTKDITLVAYFEEIINRVTYKVVHYLEKTGKDSTLNGKYERIEEVKTDQKVEDGATYHDYAQLDTDLYEKDTTYSKNKLNSQLNTDDNSVEVCQYYKLKEVEVKFKKTVGIDTLQYDTLKVKKTRSVQLPTYTLKDTHNFVGWALSESGQTQSDFVIEKTTSSLEIYALTDYQNREITYTIRKEKPDGSFDESEEIKTGKITSTHTASYANPDNSVYQNPTYSAASLVINADKNQNKIIVTILRKTYEVTFEVVDSSNSIPTRTIRHGATIGKIDESQFTAQGFVIRRAELDYEKMTKEEIEEFIVLKNHEVTLFIGIPTEKFGKYPQTLAYNPKGIHKVEDKVHELRFNSKNKDYTMQFTRSYWEDSKGIKYEKYNGEYFEIEPVDFVKIPAQNTWYTEKIIDFSPFNLYYVSYPDNAKPERSIFKAMVEDIGKVMGVEVHMPTYDSGEFSVMPAIQNNLENQLIKKYTDYALAILRQQKDTSTFYRGVDLSSFAESGVEWFRYNIFLRDRWWLGTQAINTRPYAYNITSIGKIEYGHANLVMGVVVCIR